MSAIDCESTKNISNGNYSKMHDAFQDANDRLGKRLNMQRIKLCFQKFSTVEKLLIAIFLTTAAICVGVFIIKKLELKVPADCLESKNFCQNGGTCHVNGNQGHSCFCAPGYDGEHCETVINNCAGGVLCLNRGTCVKEINTYNCICTHDFAGSHCEHSNECVYAGTCSLPSPFGTCHKCRDGHVKDTQDDTRCRPENENVTLIFTLADGVRTLSWDTSNSNVTYKARVLQKGGDVAGIDYNFRTKTMFWFSYDDKTIYKASTEEEEAEKIPIIRVSNFRVFAIALDWIYNHLYWADDEQKQIVLCNLNGTMKKVLIDTELSAPFSLVVDPLNGWMYWADKNRNIIERAGLDGSRRGVIFSRRSVWPRGLAVDFVQSRLYWTDMQHPSSVSSMNFDGTDLKVILTAASPAFPYSYFKTITMFGDYIYWIDNRSNSIYKANKCNGEELSAIHIHDENLRNVVVFDAARQPDGENHCSKRIGQCSHFCVPIPVPGAALGNGSSVSTQCVCPNGLSLSSDKHNCH